MVCVPLFVMLTGYLCNKKELTKRYFIGILPVLVTYGLCAVVTLLWRSKVWGEEISLLWGISEILRIDGGAIWYGWYIEMYIGLYLLIPFLNLIYNGLVTQQKKRILLSVMLLLTMLPISMNIYDFSTSGFWQNPNISQTYHVLLPKWWTGLWPLTYYFIGAYIREYRIRLPKFLGLAVLVGCLLGFTGYSIYRSQGTSLFRPNLDNWGGFQNTIDSIVLFLMMLSLDMTRIPESIRKIISHVAKLSLGIYLCSYISDVEVYRRFNALELTLSDQLLYYPLVVLTSFLFAGVLSQFVSWVQWLLARGTEILVRHLLGKAAKR